MTTDQTANQRKSAEPHPEPEAVSYLRVSTVRQTHTAVDIDADGNSIATQREACTAKASTLGVPIGREFIEPGKSAQSIEKRPVFKQLLAYLQEHPEVDYLIVYSRSRAFRNSIDAAITKRALSMLGVRIISCKEDFGTGYMADAMETVSDVFNELQVRQNGEDIRQKLRHKALNGGTISRAKLGYLNIRAERDGRLFNTIGLDEKRAPLIRRAYELYATGDYSLEHLCDTLADLGLTTRPSPRSPREQPVGTSKLHQMLRDPYYGGWVTVDGQLVPGRHAAIVSQELFDRVQVVIEARSSRGTRDRVLYHYLKGVLFCERCQKAGRTSRLIYTEAKGRNGQYYGYFKCMGREGRGCTLPHLPAWQVEDAVCREYYSLGVDPGFTESITELVDEVLAERQALTRDLHARLSQQLKRLDAKEQRLIDLAADDMLDRAKIRERSKAIQLERRRVEAGLADTGAELDLGAKRLRAHLDLVVSPAGYYENAPDETRRQLNAAFYEAFFLDQDDGSITVAESVLTPPFEEIRAANLAYQRSFAALAEPRTEEPMATVTPIEQARRSTNAERHGDAVASEESLTSVLADVFPVRVSSKRVVVELRGFEPLTFLLRRLGTLIRPRAPRYDRLHVVRSNLGPNNSGVRWGSVDLRVFDLQPGSMIVTRHASTLSDETHLAAVVRFDRLPVPKCLPRGCGVHGDETPAAEVLVVALVWATRKVGLMGRRDLELSRDRTPRWRWPAVRALAPRKVAQLALDVSHGPTVAFVTAC